MVLVLSFKEKKWIDKEGMPHELGIGSLYKDGGSISCGGSYPCHGTPDQRYLVSGGTLVLVESKSRSLPFVYKSDIIQVSVYGYIQRKSRQPRRVKNLASYGYIRLVVGKKKQVVYKKIELMSDREVESLHARYDAIKQGRADRVKRARTAICKGCDYKKEQCSRHN
jgi:hypothetical protein